MSTRNLAKEFFPRLHRLMNRFDDVRQRRFRAGPSLSLYPGEIQTLIAVGNNPGATVTEIGDAMGVSKSAASQFVIKLEAKGLLTKEHAPDNRRNFILELTPRGLAAVAEFGIFWEGLITELFTRLGLTNQKELRRILEVLDTVEEVIDAFIPPDPED